MELLQERPTALIFAAVTGNFFYAILSKWMHLEFTS